MHDKDTEATSKLLGQTNGVEERDSETLPSTKSEPVIEGSTNGDNGSPKIRRHQSTLKTNMGRCKTGRTKHVCGPRSKTMEGLAVAATNETEIVPQIKLDGADITTSANFTGTKLNVTTADVSDKDLTIMVSNIFELHYENN